MIFTFIQLKLVQKNILLPFKNDNCDSNIGVFSIAPNLVIALTTLRTQKLSLLFLLLQFLYVFFHGFFSALLPV